MIKFLAFLLVALFLSFSSNAGGLSEAFTQSAAGMKAQGSRMKVIAQNIANVDSTGSTPGEEPYRRKTITFKNKLDKQRGIEHVVVQKIGRDNKSDFKARFDPTHPAANNEGYVLLPNVSSSIETLDMKEAERSYEANLGAIETTKRMFMSTIDLLR